VTETLQPAPWLVDNVDWIPPGARVLDVASGRGRNTLFLAARGFQVHAVDRQAEALLGLVHVQGVPGLVTTEVIDLEAGSVSLGHRCYGGVVVFNYLHRPLMPAIVDAVADGGALIYETFTVGQAKRGHPKSPAFLLRPGEIERLVQPLRIVRVREGDFDGKLVASVVAVRG
jgi:hypothetical protein